MSPFIFIPVAFFGTSATLTVLFVFACREIRSWKQSPVETAVRDLRTATESFTPPECLNEWERRYWNPAEARVRSNCRPLASGVHTGKETR